MIALLRLSPILLLLVAAIMVNEDAQAFAKSFGLLLLALILWPARKLAELFRGRSV